MLFAAVLWTGIASPVATAHPLHTALTEISYDSTTRDVVISIRVFADDLAGSIAGLGDGADSAMSRYARGTFALADPSGQPARLRWEGTERTGDTVLLQVRAALPDGLAHAKVLSAVLCERFQDQVNIVRASYSGHVTTLLFTRGDPPKRLP
jgi:uncharacterized protein DUF6702